MTSSLILVTRRPSAFNVLVTKLFRKNIAWIGTASCSERSLRQWSLATARGADSPLQSDDDKPSIYIQESVQIQQRQRELALRLRLQKLKRRLYLFGPGGASRHEPIAKIDLLAQVRPGLRFEPSGQGFGLLVGENAVEQF